VIGVAVEFAGCDCGIQISHPIEFSYMLGGIILDRVDSINDL
jgi:hypothetical protein